MTSRKVAIKVDEPAVKRARGRPSAAKKKPPAEPAPTDPDLQNVVLALSSLDGQEMCVRELLAGLADRATLLGAQPALQKAKAEAVADHGAKLAAIKLPRARDLLAALEAEKAHLAGVFDNELRVLLEGRCQSEVARGAACDALLIPLRARGVSESLLLALPAALKLAPDERRPFDTIVVENMLQELEAHAQHVDGRVEAAYDDVENGAKSEVPTKELPNLPMLLAEEALAEDTARTFDLALKSLDVLLARASA